jgi:hypothetical protein
VQRVLISYNMKDERLAGQLAERDMSTRPSVKRTSTITRTKSPAGS